MTTNITIIDDALKEINVINEVHSASAEQGKKALRRLNQMMEKWKEEEIDLGWAKQTSTTDTIPIPDYAELAVTLALAVYAAPAFSTTASSTTIALADEAVSSLRSKMIRENLDNIDMSHMPSGTGRWGRRYSVDTDVT